MKRILRTSIPFLAAAALFSTSAFGADDQPVSLRYVCLSDQTNAYSVQVELQGESGREALAGTVTISLRPVATNLIGLSLRGQLHPKNLGGMPPMGFRPPYAMSLASLVSGPQIEPRELVIDE